MKQGQQGQQGQQRKRRFFVANVLVSSFVTLALMAILARQQLQVPPAAVRKPIATTAATATSNNITYGIHSTGGNGGGGGVRSSWTSDADDDDVAVSSSRPTSSSQQSALPFLSSSVVRDDNGSGKSSIAAPTEDDDVQLLLDFAIIGYPKTATTMLLHWLRQQPGDEIVTHYDEIHSLTKNRFPEFVERMYELQLQQTAKVGSGGGSPTSSTGNKGTLYGYKAPRDIMKAHALQLIGQHFPKTKLIVGLRHPVHWFESFYNYRVAYNVTMLPPEDLIGPCTSEMSQAEKQTYFRKQQLKQQLQQRNASSKGDDGLKERIPTCGVCTDGARFHVHLSMLGKTIPIANTSDPTTQKSAPSRLYSGEGSARRRRQQQQQQPPLLSLPNKVFLYDATQLDRDRDGAEGDGDPKNSAARRFDAFKSDLGAFLGLKQPLGDPVGRNSEAANYNPRRKYPLDICLPRYDRLRSVLLRHGRDASEWILTRFVDHPDVAVSSPAYFARQLRTWETDPCGASGDVGGT